MNGPHFRGNFFLTGLRHCLFLKASSTKIDYGESLRNGLFREKFELSFYWLPLCIH